MRDDQEDEVLEPAVAAERERCAWFCEELARIHERGAIKTRKAGSFTVRSLWPPFKRVTCVRPGWEKLAEAQEGAANSLRTVAMAIREGWTPQPDDPDEQP